MDEIIQFYFQDNAKELRREVDGILRKFGGVYEPSDYYSLADLIFAKDIIPNYDESKGDIYKFVHFTLERKIKSEITTVNAKKRTLNRIAISLDTPIESEESGLTIGDVVEDSSRDVFTEAFGEVSNKVESFLERLSPKQQKIVNLLMDGYEPSYIKEVLNMTSSDYKRHMDIIASNEKVSVLF